MTVKKHLVRYFMDGWPSEDVLTFLDAVVAGLRKFVIDAYDTFPNSFSLHKTGACDKARR